MKLIFLFSFLSLVGCGDMSDYKAASNKDDGEEKAEKSVASEGEDDTNNNDNDRDPPAAEPNESKKSGKASGAPVDCEGNYAAKIVYQDSEQLLYACVRKGQSPADDETTEEDEESLGIMLDDCPYAYRRLSDDRLKLSYVPPAGTREIRVAPAYTIYPGMLRQTVTLVDKIGTPACVVEVWNGFDLHYRDSANKLREIEVDD